MNEDFRLGQKDLKKTGSSPKFATSPWEHQCHPSKIPSILATIGGMDVRASRISMGRIAIPWTLRQAESLHFLRDCPAWRKTPACREESVSSQILMDLSVFVMFPHCTCYGKDAMLLHQKTTPVHGSLVNPEPATQKDCHSKHHALLTAQVGPSSVLFLEHITERQPVFIPRLLRFSYHFMELRLNPTTLQIIKTSVQGSLCL